MAEPPDPSRSETLRFDAIRARDARRVRISVGLRVQEFDPRRVRRAGTYLGPSGYLTYASPHRFNVDPGVVYRIKSRAQEGLGAELIGNLLAAQLDVGPPSEPILVGHASVPTDGRLDTLVGLQLGTVELEHVVNDDELRALGIRVQIDQIDWDAWARVIVLQTWIYAGDHQAMVRLTDGKVFSVDHGRCFHELAKGGPSAPVVPPLAGVAGASFDRSHLVAAIEALEGIREEDLIALVATVPDEDDRWRMPPARKLRILEWLLDRQFRVRKVLAPWMSRIS